MLLIALMALAEGQVAKFDGRTPDAEYVTARSSAEVERCLIRQGYPPQVYRQPDRPEDVMIVWTAGGMAAGTAAARVDLHSSGTSTSIKSWLSQKVVEQCAPRTGS
ncbi:hypothetical protein [Sphingomonas sp. Leaf257]|uniref:hypothetical protein n=1 Tax=Sphingomonas sp. Leaf257 TaxID=1736309 RepID=UPI0012E26789|nr:hypothetical protein [Sphingomonas sp. Leaf257]